MNEATHIVIDLETLGKGPRATIATLGIVVVERLEIAAELYLRVDMENAQRHGLECDADTALFWLRQSDAARHELTAREDRGSLESCLRQVSDLLARHWNPSIWANSPSFDCVILRSAFAACGLTPPWQYWQERDIRTLAALYPAVKDIPFEGIKHHALDDARHEAKQLVEGLRMSGEAAKKQECAA